MGESLLHSAFGLPSGTISKCEPAPTQVIRPLRPASFLAGVSVKKTMEHLSDTDTLFAQFQRC
jgi:hypothetical protein